MKRHALSRYDLEGSEGLGLLTVKRGRLTNRFKAAVYQPEPGSAQLSLTLPEYLTVKRLSRREDALSLLVRARQRQDDEYYQDPGRDHTVAWFVGAVVFALLADAALGAGGLFLILKAVG